MQLSYSDFSFIYISFVVSVHYNGHIFLFKTRQYEMKILSKNIQFSDIFR